MALFFLLFHFPLFSLHPIIMAVSFSKLPLSLMRFVCEWKTEWSYASASHQTFTSCGALECKRKTGEKNWEDVYKKRHEKTDKQEDRQWGSHTMKQTESVKLWGAHTKKGKESVKDRNRETRRQGNSWTVQTEESLSECQQVRSSPATSSQQGQIMLPSVVARFRIIIDQTRDWQNMKICEKKFPGLQKKSRQNSVCVCVCVWDINLKIIHGTVQQFLQIKDQ